MPTTSQNVSTIVSQLNGWDRSGQHGVLEFYGEANNILLQNPCEEMVKVDNSTGMLPLLTTLDTQFKYSLPSGIWRIEAIMIALPMDFNYGVNPLKNFNVEDKPIEFKVWAGRKYMVFSMVKCYDRGTMNEGILFQVNPGATTDTYYYLGYVQPTSITSENVQTQIPSRYHFSHLIPATVKLMEGFQNGTLMQARNEIEELIKPSFWNEMNKGGKGRSGYVKSRYY